MNQDKVLGYVSALIDTYVNKEERENRLFEKANLLIIIADLNNLKEFIEEANTEGQAKEQFKKFIPEDSNETCKNTTLSKCLNSKKEVAQEVVTLEQFMRINKCLH